MTPPGCPWDVQGARLCMLETKNYHKTPNTDKPLCVKRSNFIHVSQQTFLVPRWVMNPPAYHEL